MPDESTPPESTPEDVPRPKVRVGEGIDVEMAPGAPLPTLTEEPFARLGLVLTSRLSAIQLGDIYQQAGFTLLIAAFCVSASQRVGLPLSAGQLVGVLIFLFTISLTCLVWMVRAWLRAPS